MVRLIQCFLEKLVNYLIIRKLKSELIVINTILELSKQCGYKVEISTISRRQWLSKKDQKNILISLVIKDGRMRDLSYDPGDHVVVFPTNSDEDVDIVLEHMTNLPKNPLSRIKLMEKGRNTGKAGSKKYQIHYEVMVNSYTL